MSWRTLLVLGGIGSGKSEYAQTLLADFRRLSPGTADGLSSLVRLLGEAKPDESLLVESLDGWAAGDQAEPEALAAAVHSSPAARVVLLGSEQGLATAPSNAAGRRLATQLGALNRAVGEVADVVVLVVAGQPSWLKGAGRVTALAGTAPATLEGPAMALTDLSRLPAPDEEAKAGAAEHLTRLGAVSLGTLSEIVRFAAGGQRVAVPRPWREVRVLVLHGDHAGALSKGLERSASRAAALRDGTSPLSRLAAPTQAGVQIVQTDPAAPIESGPAAPAEAVEAALEHGWRLADRAADEGVDALVLGSIGDGADAAAAAVVAAIAPNTDAASVLALVRTDQGTIDDQAWMRRCAAIRDAVYRAKSATRTTGRAVLAELGGPDIATAAGILLGAAARRTPVLWDGPVTAAAALVARSLTAAARHWWLLPDHGRHPTVLRASEVLSVSPPLDLRLDLGEGATALAALPLLNTALELAATLPITRPASRS